MNNELDILGLDEIEIENTSIEEIDNENVNLMFLAIDQSGSMGTWINDMKQSLNEFKQAIIDSKEADQILVARADFEDFINIGGYKKISEFDTDFRSGGMTAMFDVIVEGSQKLKDYMDYLKQQGMRVKAVFSVFSDGDDNSSRTSLLDARRCIEKLNDEEIVTAFISFGGSSVNTAKDITFKNILPVGSSASELRKAFNCLSKSVVENSKSVVNNTDDFFTI
jgi:uncharacterized protein YegL